MQLLKYLESNLDYLNEFIERRIPDIRICVPEATYMAWLDFHNIALSEKELRSFIITKAGLGLNDGPGFGPGGKGFQRINFALPKAKLHVALEQLEKAINTIGKL
jgi:cysteine-S-conjugate beta-lyase